MSANITSITNISKQTIPILINSIPSADASASSTMAASKAEQTHISPGAELSIESKRVDVGQLEQLRRLKLITYVLR